MKKLRNPEWWLCKLEVDNMEEIKKPIVIAIASISGGGKTTVVEKLNEELPNSKALFFDVYDLEGPENV